MKRWVLIASGTLVLMLVGIATLLWSEARQRDALGNKQENLHNTLNSLVIQRTGKADIKIRLEEGRWQIHEPCTINVNENRLQPLLSIVSPAAFSYAAVEVDLEAAGLLNPVATIIANNQRIDIGNTDLSGERRYVQRGERVEFAQEWILPLLDGGLSALSALELFDDAITSVTVGELSPAQEGISDDNANELPQVQEGINDKKVNELTQGHNSISDDAQLWQQLTAQQIVPWPLADSAPQSPQYAVTVHSETDERRLEAFTTPAFTAIVFEGARCAYLLPNEALSPSSR